MKQKLTIQQFVKSFISKSGGTRKMAEAMIKALPEVIEEGLIKDGDVKVKGLGTFKLKWVQARSGRNPKTGSVIEVPAHSRVIFHPESKLKDRANEDFKYLTFSVIKEPGDLHEEPVVLGRPAEEEHKPEPFPEEPPKQEQVAEKSISEEIITSVPEPVMMDTEKAPPPDIPRKKKSSLYWVIPLTVLVILILFVVFYFRAIREPREKENQQAATAVEQAVSKPADTARPIRTDTVVAQAVAEPIPVQKPEETKPRPVATPSSYIIPEGTHLFRLARDLYGNEYFWVLIYKANQDKITNPDQVISGLNLVIPSLEGTKDQLTRNDSLALSEGYRLLYDYYNSRQDSVAENFRKGMNLFRPR
jgi:nucleoid DNA-binding protein